MMKIILPIILGIAIFLFSIIFVDSWIVQNVYHLLGGSDKSELGPLIKLIVWVIVVGLTMGITAIISTVCGLILGAFMNVYDKDRRDKKWRARRV